MKKQKRRAAAKVDQGSRLSVIQSDVAGIDIGSREMFVCGPADQQGRREMRVFATTTQRIQECVGWLKQQKVRSVAMESTGVYWIPVLEIMESSGLEVLLVDTRPLSRVPGGRRTWKTASGCRRCIVTDCSAGRIVRASRSVSCGPSFANGHEVAPPR
jgi:hypothetical protein